MRPLPKKKRLASKRRGRHPENALTDAFCRNVAESGRYPDAEGLYLVVDPSGARRWVQRLFVRGRERQYGLGSFRLVSLAKARQRALANRKLAREGGVPGGDPADHDDSPDDGDREDSGRRVGPEPRSRRGSRRRQGQPLPGGNRRWRPVRHHRC